MYDGFLADFPLAHKLADRDRIKIKFLSGTIPFYGSIHFNPAYYALKTHYRRRGQNNSRIDWLPAIHYNIGLCEGEIAKIIESEQPDVICMSLYIWNHDLYSRLGRYIKANHPDILLLGGGPEVYAHKQPQLFWQKNEWLDAVAYGDGESAFTVMIDAILGTPLLAPASNISYQRAGHPVVEPFQRFKDAELNAISYFVDNAQEIAESVRAIRSADAELEIIMNWEFTKGCPYRCSFCDWSSGLHHKVTRKAYDWRQDLAFFSSLDVSVRWCDANIGLFKDDMDIVKHAFELEDANPMFKFSYNNLAKLNKQAVYAMIDYTEQVRPGQKVHAITVQDIDEDVLENIDRPDVPWEEHKSYILETKARHPQMIFNMEMMIGLPGQTLESAARNIIEFAEIGAHGILGHIWCMLINSPGYQEDYKLRHGLRVEPALHISKLDPRIQTRDDVLRYLDDCEWYHAETVVGTNTADLADILAISGMVMLYNNLAGRTLGKIDRKILIPALENMRYWRDFGQQMAAPIEQDLVERGRMLLIPESKGKPLTFHQYFNDKTVVVDIIKTAYKSY